MIVAEALGKAYGERWALREASFSVPPGAFLAVLGRNGAGKTTLVRLLTGQLRPDAGRARIAGLDVASRPLPLRKRLGVMPEDGALLEDLTGRHYLEVVGCLHGLERGTLEARIEELSTVLEVDFARPAAIRDYSTGMRKKLAFASALLHRPEALFLDEPFEGLDPAAAATLTGLLERLRNAGMTLVMTSHQLERAERLATHVLLLDGGRVVLDGSAHTLLQGGESLESLFLRHVSPKAEPCLSWI
jgi:ABC-2 type transport system ATP-binding protein